jgi:hypothetical protein
MTAGLRRELETVVVESDSRGFFTAFRMTNVVSGTCDGFVHFKA